MKRTAPKVLPHAAIVLESQEDEKLPRNMKKALQWFKQKGGSFLSCNTSNSMSYNADLTHKHHRDRKSKKRLFAQYVEVQDPI